MNDSPRFMWTTDRTEQVSYLRELAADLHHNNPADSDNFESANDYAAALVDWWLGEIGPGRHPDDEALPDWWSDHDRSLLISFIAAKYTD